jgi:hypothetical protein
LPSSLAIKRERELVVSGVYALMEAKTVIKKR